MAIRKKKLLISFAISFVLILIVLLFLRISPYFYLYKATQAVIHISSEDNFDSKVPLSQQARETLLQNDLYYLPSGIFSECGFYNSNIYSINSNSEEISGLYLRYTEKTDIDTYITYISEYSIQCNMNKIHETPDYLYTLKLIYINDYRIIYHSSNGLIDIKKIDNLLSLKPSFSISLKNKDIDSYISRVHVKGDLLFPQTLNRKTMNLSSDILTERAFITDSKNTINYEFTNKANNLLTELELNGKFIIPKDEIGLTVSVVVHSKQNIPYINVDMQLFSFIKNSDENLIYLTNIRCGD